jgi:hypothetical protein
MNPSPYLTARRIPAERPQLPIEVDLGLRPARLHQRQGLVEPGHRLVRVDAKGLERAATPAGRDAHLNAAMAQAVERADRLGQVDGVVQREYEHGATQP